MPRKGFVARREVPADSVFGSDLVQKFINSMMWDGKRSNAQRIFYGAMDQIAQKTNDDPLKIFQEGRRKRQAGAGSQDAARGRRELPGSGRSQSVPPAVAGDSLASALRAHAFGQDDDRQAGRRAARCGQQPAAAP